LILERWHEYTDCPRLKGLHLLHITALYADIETLQILAGTDHLRVRQDRNYGIGDFSDRLRQRADHTEKLSCAFEELLHVINSAPDARQSPDQLVEVGILQPINTCARPAPIANQMECLTGNHSTDRFTHLEMLNADDDSASSDDAFEEASETFQVRE
jgi:hypothetical protein